MRLLLFIGWIVADAMIIGRLTEHYGGWPVFAWLLATAVIGMSMMRSQSLRTLREVQAAQAHGQTPAIPILDGMLRAVGAILLVLPGALSDIAALLLLWPPLRGRVARSLARRSAPQAANDPNQPIVIEGEFRHVPPQPSSPPRLPPDQRR